MTLTREVIERQAVMEIVVAVGVAIRDLGSVPSGHLYARLMSQGINLDSYNRIIEILVKTNMVRREPSHLLVWIGPADVDLQ